MELTKKIETYEDAIMKRAWEIFAREGLKLLGITKKVKDSGKTELVSLDINYLYLDYTYLMEDDSYAHFEFQTTNNNTSDLKRFRAYEATLSHQTGKDVITYVIYSGGIKKPNSVLKTGINTYAVQALSLANLDGDEILEAIHKKISSGISLTDEDAISVIFLPLMSGTYSVKERILASIRAAEHFEKSAQINLESMAYAFALKFLDEQDLNEVKEELKMTVLGKMLMEDGRAEGEARGKVMTEAKVVLRSIAKGFDNETIAELTGLSVAEIEEYRIISQGELA